MSRVTDTILVTGGGHLDGSFEDTLSAIGSYLASRGQCRGLVAVDANELPPGWYGGSRFLQCDVAIGAYDHLDLPSFLAFLRGMPWTKEHNAVQLLAKQDHEFFFTLYEIWQPEWAKEPVGALDEIRREFASSEEFRDFGNRMCDAVERIAPEYAAAIAERYRQLKAAAR